MLQATNILPFTFSAQFQPISGTGLVFVVALKIVVVVFALVFVMVVVVVVLVVVVVVVMVMLMLLLLLLFLVVVLWLVLGWGCYCIFLVLCWFGVAVLVVSGVVVLLQSKQKLFGNLNLKLLNCIYMLNPLKNYILFLPYSSTPELTI